MKKIISSILVSIWILSFVACGDASHPEDSITYDTKNAEMTSTTTTDTETLATSVTPESSSTAEKPIWTKPQAPNGWIYPTIDLSDGIYTASHLNPDISASRFGYKMGSYEYDYFRALSGISFYALIASQKISAIVKDVSVSELAEGFYEIISKDTFAAPYEDILYHTFSLLKDRNFTLFSENDTMISQYTKGLSYELDISETRNAMALSFTDIDTKLTEYANELLILKEKYPYYAGEFLLSEEAIIEVEAMIASCKIVALGREEQRDAWRTYFKDATPKVTVTAEIIPEKDTVKLTFVSDHKLSVAVDPSYIVNFQGEYIKNESGNSGGYLWEPMESPVICYIPIGYFYGIHGEIKVTKYQSTEPMRYYYETLKIEADTSQVFSDELLVLSDPFLDAALKAEFGGSYSERDLSQIKDVQIYYYHTERGAFLIQPSITFVYYNKSLGKYDNGTSVYQYSDFYEEDWTGDFPEETLLDMQYFPLLQSVKFLQSRSKTTPSEVPLPDGYLDCILVKEYTADDFSE